MVKIYSVLFSAICLTASAQEVQWQKDIKSSTQDFLSTLSVTVDGQFLVSGSSIQPPKMTSVSSSGGARQNNGYDFHLVKLDQDGREVWEKFFQGQNHDFLTATVATQEGGFLLAGTTLSPEGLDKKGRAFGGSDIWLIKIAENGTEEWQRTIGTAGNDEARAVVQSTDLGYFVAGSIQDKETGYGSKDVWLLKLDKNGKPTKEIVLGGSGLDEVEKMIPTADGGALIGIYSRSGKFTEKKSGAASTTSKNSSPTEKSETIDRTLSRSVAFFTDEKDGPEPQRSTSGPAGTAPAKSPVSKNSGVPRTSFAKDSENYGEGDFWIIKLDKEGNVEWQKNVGGKGDDHIRAMALTGSGFVVGGESRSDNSGNKTSGVEEGTDLWIIALDHSGNEQFQKSYSFGNRDVLMSLNTIWDKKGTASRGYLVGGYTQSEGRKEKDDETFWMLHLDEKGDEVWRKYIEGKSREKVERLVSAAMLFDGSFVLAGTSAKELGKENWKVVKLGDSQVKELIEKQEIRIYPNPVSDYCYVEIGFDFKEATIELYDMGGRLVDTVKTKNRVTKIITQPLIQGVFLAVVKTETKIVNAKIIKK
ncbi:T9SS type A sorting domain-containing protein [Marnyiella aurantia]|uniref:T9SS type A sorting domain-containing protein n=1 Tax=Marnyiella aurantia TaxID=2758037 RepID=A0A7D7LM36_9FLAO|nr:T9SS type A sorting domain-containing protein [Marnyiella aurantia]MBA5246532.1 T9SS type A sorting domain-containing protein [Marnyiella aurantia]QMS98104.1 T9SS type A sorting domain-containing protein [Marnyiella aurantia]